jgi:hypothetical protein
MFNLETQILLNRFRCQVHLSELERAEKAEDAGAKDRAARDQKEKERREYVESGLKRIQDWERRVGGK